MRREGRMRDFRDELVNRGVRNLTCRGCSVTQNVPCLCHNCMNVLQPLRRVACCFEVKLSAERDCCLVQGEERAPATGGAIVDS